MSYTHKWGIHGGKCMSFGAHSWPVCVDQLKSLYFQVGQLALSAITLRFGLAVMRARG